MRFVVVVLLLAFISLTSIGQRTEPNYRKPIKFDKSVFSKEPVSREEATRELILELEKSEPDINILKAMVELGANPRAATSTGWTLLHEAACHNDAEFALQLIHRKVDINARNKKNHVTPLIIASCKGAVDVVRILLSQPGLIKDAKTRKHKNAVSLAATMKIKMMLEGRIAHTYADAKKLEIKYNYGINAVKSRPPSIHAHTNSTVQLHIGIDNNRLKSPIPQNVGRISINATEKLQKLLDDGSKDLRDFLDCYNRGADVHTMKKYDFWNPLHYAARNGRLDTVQLLIERGVSLFDTTNRGYTPLLCAIVGYKMHTPGCLEVIKYLTSIMYVDPSSIRCKLREIYRAEPVDQQLEALIENQSKIRASVNQQLVQVAKDRKSVKPSSSVVPPSQDAGKGNASSLNDFESNNNLEDDIYRRRNEARIKFEIEQNTQIAKAHPINLNYIKSNVPLTPQQAPLTYKYGSWNSNLTKFDPTQKVSSDALFAAVLYQNPEYFKNVLAQNVSINHKDRYGNTALYIAVYLDYDRFVSFLLSCKDIDINARNQDSLCAYDVAKNITIWKLLNSRQAVHSRELNVRSSKKNSLLNRSTPTLSPRSIKVRSD